MLVVLTLPESENSPQGGEAGGVQGVFRERSMRD